MSKLVKIIFPFLVILVLTFIPYWRQKDYSDCVLADPDYCKYTLREYTFNKSTDHRKRNQEREENLDFLHLFHSLSATCIGRGGKVYPMVQGDISEDIGHGADIWQKWLLNNGETLCQQCSKCINYIIPLYVKYCKLN